jgi:hypothetical protein
MLIRLFMGLAHGEHTVTMLAVLQGFLAIGDSFFSGTDKAILYESMDELGMVSCVCFILCTESRDTHQTRLRIVNPLPILKIIITQS